MKPLDLFRLAGQSILMGLGGRRQEDPAQEDLPAELREPGACFVTLKTGGDLRGCIGSPEAWRPLGQDLAANAFASAFRDPRFPPLDASELGELEMEISLLTAPEPIPCGSEEELLALLRPHEDGLIIEEGSRRALFLPAVWESLPEPAEFLLQLKLKAGMGTETLPAGFRALRFAAREISSLDHPEARSFWSRD